MSYLYLLKMKIMHGSLGFMVNNHPTLRVEPKDKGWLLNPRLACIVCGIYRIAALQHIECIHSTFDGNGPFLQHQLMSLNRFCTVFLINVLHTLGRVTSLALHTGL